MSSPSSISPTEVQTSAAHQGEMEIEEVGNVESEGVIVSDNCKINEKSEDEETFVGDKKKLRRRRERQQWFEKWNDKPCDPVENDTEDDVEEEAEVARPARDPGQPPKEQRAVHDLTHSPFRRWCAACMMA